MSIHIAYLIAALSLFIMVIFLNKITAHYCQVGLSVSLFRSSQIMLLYCTLFYLFASLFYYNGSILNEYYLLSSSSWSWGPLFMWWGATALGVLLTNGRVSMAQRVHDATQLPEKFSIIFSLVGFSLAVGHAVSGEYVLIIMSFSCFFCAYGACNRPSNFLLAISFAALIVCLPSASFSKRNVIFPTGVLLLLLLQKGVLSRKFFVILGALALLAIVPMSVMRGYGGYGVTTFWESIVYSWDYVNNPLFPKFIASNFEFSAFYFHGINSIELFSDDVDFLYGSTLLRVLISPLIYLNLMDGVGSSIEVYTSLFDPNFRAIGGSYPVNIFSEFFMNFGVLSIMIYPLFLKIIDFVESRFSKYKYDFSYFAMRGVFIFCCLLLTRGAGFSLFAFNLFVAIIPIVIFSFCVPARAGGGRRLFGSA